MTTTHTQNVKANILYVDDEYYNLTAFSAAFRKYYNIHTTTSVHEAMEILRQKHIDLVITDQRMPEMSGVQFLEAMLLEFPEPVRMILTGFTDVEAIKKAINNGCVLRYITKPWDENELKQIIDMGVKIHELEQNHHELTKQLEHVVTQRKQTVEFFEKYIPHDLLNQILNFDKVELYPSKGEYRIISSLFSDIRRFTQFSENMDPKTVLAYLNRYFSIMINCVIKNHGYIYKLIGDGLLATFGAPTSTIHNQRNAIYCALDMIEELKNFNELIGHEHPETKIGIGISTGAAVVGHIVSEHTLSYIAIGEAIDKVSQIEAMTRSMPNVILIDAPTYEAVKNEVEVEPLTGENLSGELYKVIAKKNQS